MTAETKISQERMLGTIKKHERLIELAKKLNSFGKITEVIFTNLSEVVTPNERVLLCVYSLQTGNRYTEDGQVFPQFGSCELNVLTDRNYLRLGFFPTYHNVRVVNVDHIAELNIQSMFGSRYDVDSEVGAEENSFKPTQLKASFVFKNSRDEKVAEWEVDTLDEQNIGVILSQAKALSQFIGVPLSKVQL